MGTLALGEALGKVKMPRKARSGAPHPTGAPVLRDSVEAGAFEHVFFVTPAKRETDRLLRAAMAASCPGGAAYRGQCACVRGNPEPSLLMTEAGVMIIKCVSPDEALSRYQGDVADVWRFMIDAMREDFPPEARLQAQLKYVAERKFKG